MKPKKSMENELRNRLIGMVELTRKEPGCITYTVFEQVNGSVFLYEIWRTQDDLDEHFKKPYLKHFIATQNEVLEVENDAHFGQVISSVDEVPANTPPADTNALYICSVKKSKKGHEAELKEALLSLVAPTRKEPGCISYILYQEKDGSIFLYEAWKSQKDLDQHFTKPYVVDFRKNVEKMTYVNQVYFGSLITPSKE